MPGPGVPNSKIASYSARKWMKNLALLELTLSMIAFCLGSTCTGINFESDRLTCVYGTGIWVGVLCMIRAIFGLIALNLMLKGIRCLLAAYFVLCILSTVACCVLAAISSLWIQRANEFYQLDSQTAHLASYVLNVLLLILALLHTICCGFSTGIMTCYYFGCNFAISQGDRRQVTFDTNHTVISPAAFSHNNESGRNFDIINVPPPAYDEISPPYFQNAPKLCYVNEPVNGEVSQNASSTISGNV